MLVPLIGLTIAEQATGNPIFLYVNGGLYGSTVAVSSFFALRVLSVYTMHLNNMIEHLFMVSIHFLPWSGFITALLSTWIVPMYMPQYAIAVFVFSPLLLNVALIATIISLCTCRVFTRESVETTGLPRSYSPRDQSQSYDPLQQDTPVYPQWLHRAQKNIQLWIDEHSTRTSPSQTDSLLHDSV